MTSYSAAAWAPVNIALVKHWGFRDERATLPARPSLSVAIKHGATTLVEWESHRDPEHLMLVNDTPLARDGGAKAAAAHELLDYIRVRAGLEGRRALVRSMSTMPLSGGMASSSAGAAALTVAALKAAGLGEQADSETNLCSALYWVARAGSLSAIRSLLGGFSLLDVRGGELRLDAVSTDLELRVFSCLVEERPKTVSSSEGHLLAPTSYCWDVFRDAGEPRVSEVVGALKRADLTVAGALIEQDALSMHGVMLTSRPPLIYATDATWSVWREVVRWRRQDGLGAWCTLDAGANPHVLCAAVDAEEVAERLKALIEVRRIYHSGVSGKGAHLIKETAWR